MYQGKNKEVFDVEVFVIRQALQVLDRRGEKTGVIPSSLILRPHSAGSNMIGQDPDRL